MRNVLLFPLSILFFITQVNAQNWAQTQKIVASDREVGDNFGGSVSINGHYALVGAYYEDENTVGTDSMESAGSVYIYEKSAGSWNEVQKIVASDRALEDHFGYDVDHDGNYAIVGAYKESDDTTMFEAGAAYVFERDTILNEWIEVQKLTASDREEGNWFGFSVSLSGNYAVVGAYNEHDNEAGLDSLHEAGAAYIYERNGNGTWVEVQKIVGSDRQKQDFFGYDVAIEGDKIIVGAWSQDLDAQGNNPVLHAGAVYFFKRDSVLGTWNETQKIVASDRINDSGGLGNAVSLSGSYLVAGASNGDYDALGNNFINGAGAAYVFEYNGSLWIEIQKVVAWDRAYFDVFGFDVSISDNHFIVGAIQENEDEFGGNTLTGAGSAYLFKRDGNGTWNLTRKIVPSDREFGDRFGHVSIDNHTILIGAETEREDEFGGNTLWYAGSAYLFEGEPLSIHENEAKTYLQIYPNPTSNEATINLEGVSSDDHILKVEIYDNMGRMIKNIPHLNSSYFVLKRETLNAGIYLVNVIGKHHRYSSRIVFE